MDNTKINLQVLEELQAGALSEEAKHTLEMVVNKELREVLVSSPRLLSDMQFIVKDAKETVLRELKKGIDHAELARLIAAPFVENMKRSKEWESGSAELKRAQQIIEAQIRENVHPMTTKLIQQQVETVLQPLLPTIETIYREAVADWVRKALEERVFFYKTLVEDLAKRVSKIEDRMVSGVPTGR